MNRSEFFELVHDVVDTYGVYSCLEMRMTLKRIISGSTVQTVETQFCMMVSRMTKIFMPASVLFVNLNFLIDGSSETRIVGESINNLTTTVVRDRLSKHLSQ